MSLGSSYLLAPGIRFNDCMFSEPVRLDAWTPPPCAGLFGILVSDPSWAPKPFRAIYFGEFGNNITRKALLAEYHKLIEVSRGATLMISVFPMPFSTTTQRCGLRSELVSAYNPACQGETDRSRMDLALKLDDLEKRHQEQAAQVMLLLANANRPLEAQPEPRRHGFGFVPQAEPAN